MEKILVIACGATKNETDTPVRALDLYKGRQFALARRLEQMGWTVLILSAGYGCIEADHKVLPYERVITPAYADRAIAKIKALSLSAWTFRIWTQEAKQVVFYGGEQYRRVFDQLVETTGIADHDDFAPEMRAEITHIVGAGCGEHYSVLAEIVAEEEAMATA